LLALALAGCLSQRIASTSTSITNKPDANAPTKTESAAPSVPVKLYKKAEDLVGELFHDLGEVSGGDCQSTIQDSPLNLATARKHMQIRAAYMRANAVLLHDCQITSGIAGCYQQAVCQGSALNVSSK